MSIFWVGSFYIPTRSNSLGGPSHGRGGPADYGDMKQIFNGVKGVSRCVSGILELQLRFEIHQNLYSSSIFILSMKERGKVNV